MKRSEDITKLVGTWRHEDSVVEYSISVLSDPLTVTGIDTNDGEKLRITDVRLEGPDLLFTSTCPSTRYRLRHVLRPARGNQIEHEYTRIEKWRRVKPTK
jgi:hypothetical protein